MVQCNGLSKKGVRCKKQIIQGPYCVYHKPQYVPLNDLIIDQPQQLIQENHNGGNCNEILTKDSLKFECYICMDEYDTDLKITCSANIEHHICQACLEAYVKSKVTDLTTDLKCVVDTKCNGLYSLALVEKLIDPKLYLSYFERDVVENINKNTTIKDENEYIYSCPKCLVFSIIVDVEMHELMKTMPLVCDNPTCGFVSCFQCGSEHHGLSPCLTKVGFTGDSEVRHKLEEILNKHRVRKCHGCNVVFTRIDGCNRMTCPKCGNISCYYCKKKINGNAVSAYEHFDGELQGALCPGSKCPMWTSESIISKLSLLEALDEIILLPDYDNYYNILCQLEKEHLEIISHYYQPRNFSKFIEIDLDQLLSENKINCLNPQCSKKIKINYDKNNPRFLCDCRWLICIKCNTKIDIQNDKNHFARCTSVPKLDVIRRELHRIANDVGYIHPKLINWRHYLLLTLPTKITRQIAHAN